MSTESASPPKREIPARTAALVVAAGRGSRAGHGDTPKQYQLIGGAPVLARTLHALDCAGTIDAIQVVIHRDDMPLYEACMAGLSLACTLLPPAIGGETRQRSVLLGLRALAQHVPDRVLIHDAARPFVTKAVIDATLQALARGDTGAIASIPVVDTLKSTSFGTNRVDETVDREQLRIAQTPQGFRFDTILAAHEDAARGGPGDLTDDAAVAQWAGETVRFVAGDPANVKITTAEDLMQADRKLTLENWAARGDIRVASAYDVHAFEAGDHVMLGGIEIAHGKALKGHSDADVVLHALTDAILATLCDADIGHHFPPSDPAWHKASSDRFLAFAADRVRERDGAIAHLDTTVVCEEPKIGPHREAMRARIAEICGIPLSRVSVKATTSESLGFTGRGEGIAALASATVRLPFCPDETD
ncbi:bifunctional 2-C-methyl-D-erythritol 4-phosphate cytidylyltransferase/2-C-methyl-D-erythritol 2,4-cyclodiphosphate synthase [Stappia sp. ES.058]|uniref:bifunctional 2-C-methyl-D-erythritol 4-phosphate cytidylyltransferase/2-C-methyl-D-erythritol 2,4-cyclodiphosphate synthase n=1 Tax=Stappia sp. ES.058 TaxID=1881061 RepID=UPI00087D301F|nr:bifunctional 2-C-methyl-D-erythritol 4-phosphate cytidylyltransferase/2-C-methyl-D-erythritol 2,4-cyclodiphosphate synthase [Stappia sp. ES.058]SDU10428.1 2-C-methyl-D-erythritol 2,4-cyclodiphosphate synthase [Stappia sp. ES.058]